MAKESKADRIAREAIEREVADKEKAAFRATLPLKFLQMIAKAHARGDVRAEVFDHPEGGIHVKFKFPAPSDSSYEREETLWLDSEPWDVESVQAEFTRLDEEARERARIRQIAQEAYDLLSQAQRDALGVRKPY